MIVISRIKIFTIRCRITIGRRIINGRYCFMIMILILSILNIRIFRLVVFHDHLLHMFLFKITSQCATGNEFTSFRMQITETSSSFFDFNTVFFFQQSFEIFHCCSISGTVHYGIPQELLLCLENSHCRFHFSGHDLIIQFIQFLLDFISHKTNIIIIFK